MQNQNFLFFNQMLEKRKDLIWIIRIALVFALGFMVYFVFLTVIIPVSRFRIELPAEAKKAENKIFQPDQEWLTSVDDSLKNKIAGVISRESYLIACLEMTKTDSISLAVSLPDSSVSLVVQGVTIYKAKIFSFKVSNAILKTDPFVIAHWLAKPFVINNHFASIQKAPVLYKKAPKDTIEAMSQLEIDPFKDDLDPVYISMNLDRKLNLIIEQVEPLERGNLKKLKKYRRDLKSVNRKNVFNHLLNFTPIEFIPEISIVIDKRAARVIYRALPVDALVAIQL
jgi:hypothetical protein